VSLPVFKAMGAGSETAPAWPAGHAAGDFGLLCVEVANAGTDIATPSGWTKLAGCPILRGANAHLTLFYRFATSGSETAPSIAGSSDHAWGVIYTATGVNQTNPIHSITTLWSTGNRVDSAGMTTYLEDCLILSIFGYHIDNAGPVSSGETNASLSSLTERYDAGTTTNTGGGIVIIEGGLATPGTIDPTNVTFTPSGNATSAVVALQAAGRSFGMKSRIVNTRM
jgi:hypothetical protein